MKKFTLHTSTLLTILAGLSMTATADDLTMMVEQDLARLGYETGPVDGEETMETVIAISKFQAENGMEVDGAVSQQLARALMGASANPGQQSAPASATAATPAAASQPPSATDAATLQAAQNECLQNKMAAAQASQKKKRGFGRLFNAVARNVTRQGNTEMAQTAGDIYNASATADDLAAAAKDLGLTEDDVAACQNP